MKNRQKNVENCENLCSENAWKILEHRKKLQKIVEIVETREKLRNN